MFFFFKQKTAYDMRISDWSSDVCSSDLSLRGLPNIRRVAEFLPLVRVGKMHLYHRRRDGFDRVVKSNRCVGETARIEDDRLCAFRLSFVQPINQMAFVIGLTKIDLRILLLRHVLQPPGDVRSEEHTS